MTESRASYGPAALVVLGWYATVCIAAVVGTLATPAAPPGPDCSDWCLTPGQSASLLLVFAIPAVAVALGVSLGLAAAVVRLVDSPILAGTLASAAVLIAGALLLALR